MEYRKFGDIDFNVSALGFGAMRLPIVDGDPGKIDEKKAIKMMRYAIDEGVNYIDTAWPYHQEKSELLVGKALKDGYRQKVKIATKLPVWLIENEKDFDYYLEKQLLKLDIDYIDFYLLHALNSERWSKMKILNVFNWIEKVMNEGKIKFIGFSFHDEYETFVEIVNAYNWDFCQIQYNYLDTEYQAGKKGLEYAHKKGLGVIIMEPLRGGALAGEPPVNVKKILKEKGIDKTITDLGLQWLWNQKEISLVLSGMSTIEQVKENTCSAKKSSINNLSKKELSVINLITDKMRGPVSCTRCSYCMPCPNNVDIPGNFLLYNEAKLYDKVKDNQEKYSKLEKSSRADNCIQCSSCEDACPQNLPIMNLLEEVAAYMKI